MRKITFFLFILILLSIISGCGGGNDYIVILQVRHKNQGHPIPADGKATYTVARASGVNQNNISGPITEGWHVLKNKIGTPPDRIEDVVLSIDCKNQSVKVPANHKFEFIPAPNVEGVLHQVADAAFISGIEGILKTHLPHYPPLSSDAIVYVAYGGIEVDCDANCTSCAVTDIYVK